MSKQKEKKIKKLKKMHIGPYIISSILIFFISTIFLSCISHIFVQYMQNTKIESAHENAEQFADAISYAMAKEQTLNIDESSTNVYDIIKNMQYLLHYSGTICLVDENQKVIKRFGRHIPDFENELFFAPTEELNLDFKTSYKDTIYFEFKDNILKLLASEGNNTCATLDCWLIQPLDYGNAYVYVEMEITLKQNELIYVFITIALISILVVLFIVVYLVTSFGAILTQRRLSKILYLDSITGDKNWLYFRIYTPRILKKYTKQKYALISLEMTKYRNYCNCYSNDEGENLLENFSKLFLKEKRKGEIFSRNTGAEFGLLLYYNTDEELKQRLEDLCAKLQNLCPHHTVHFHAGIYPVDNRKYSPTIMYENAVTAKNTITLDTTDDIVWFKEEMLERQKWETFIENNMENALSEHQFAVYLQPKYNTKLETLAGAEALVRWIHPEKGIISPGYFIPLFEKNGFILSLDDYMIAQVAKQQAKWMKQDKKLVPISINVSRAHFTQENLAEHICKIVDAYQVPHELIELELTESAFFDNKEVLLHTVHKLKSYGFPVSMDDFGSGYSSLNTLKDLPLDVLKLDAEFFRGENTDIRGKIIVKEALHLAKELEMKTVAEGIETKEQVQFLAEEGCDLIQGYYFAKPMPISEFEERLQVIDQPAE